MEENVKAPLKRIAEIIVDADLEGYIWDVRSLESLLFFIRTHRYFRIDKITLTPDCTFRIHRIDEYERESIEFLADGSQNVMYVINTKQG